jgi:hypothetical protein
MLGPAGGVKGEAQTTVREKPGHSGCAISQTNARIADIVWRHDNSRGDGQIRPHSERAWRSRDEDA